MRAPFRLHNFLLFFSICFFLCFFQMPFVHSVSLYICSIRFCFFPTWFRANFINLKVALLIPRLTKYPNMSLSVLHFPFEIGHVSLASVGASIGSIIWVLKSQSIDFAFSFLFSVQTNISQSNFEINHIHSTWI